MKKFSYKETRAYTDIHNPKGIVGHSIHCAFCEKVWTPKEGGEPAPKTCPFCGIAWTWGWKVKLEKEEDNE